MRQAGYLAAAGSYALEHHVDRLAQDHAKAKAVAGELEPMPWVTEVLPTETNLVVFRVVDAGTAGQLVRHLRQRDIAAINAGNFIRFAFHLDVSDSGTNALIEALRDFRASG
jgi:threonine aldolase